MFKIDRQLTMQLDRIGKAVLQAASRNDEAVNAAAESPFLYARIRAAIAKGETPDEAGGWLSLFLIARRAVPAMALVALLTVIPTLMLLNRGAGTVARYDDDTFFDTQGNSLPGKVLANGEGLTRDDVFNIVVDRTDRGNIK